MDGFISFACLRIAYNNGYRFIVHGKAKESIAGFLEVGYWMDIAETEGWVFDTPIFFERE